MKTVAVLAVLAVAIAAAAAAPQPAGSNLKLVNDPVRLNAAMYDAYEALWHFGGDFVAKALYLTRENKDAQAYIGMHKFNFEDNTKRNYQKFQEKILSGSITDAEIESQVKAEAYVGNIWADEVTFETLRTVKTYTPQFTEELTELSDRTKVAVAASFQSVVDLLKPTKS